MTRVRRAMLSGRWAMVGGSVTAALLLICCWSARTQALFVDQVEIDTRQAPPAQAAADWPMYNHDLAGWRFNPAEKTLGLGNVGQLVEKWRFPAVNSNETIGVVHATPSVVAGEVYFGTATFPAFYKVSRHGMLCWVYRHPARKAVLPPTDGAAVTDKLRAAASDAGIFSSALVADGAVYFADTGGKPMYRDVGDIIGSGIAVGNGVVYFTAVGSGKLIALNAATGAVLKEIDLGPVFAGPSLSRGRVYVGGGNTLWSPSPFECFFPKQYTGSIRCFGLPGKDEIDELGKSDE